MGAVRIKAQRNRRGHGLRVDAQDVLGHTVNLKLDVRREPDVDADNAETRQIARHA
jgi:hypothetical protein